jgi:hypothetical protein
MRGFASGDLKKGDENGFVAELGGDRDGVETGFQQKENFHVVSRFSDRIFDKDGLDGGDQHSQELGFKALLL